MYVFRIACFQPGVYVWKHCLPKLNQQNKVLIMCGETGPMISNNEKFIANLTFKYTVHSYVQEWITSLNIL